MDIFFKGRIIGIIQKQATAQPSSLPCHWHSSLASKQNPIHIWAKTVATKRDKKTGPFGWPIGLDLENPYIDTSCGEGGNKSCYTWNGRGNSTNESTSNFVTRRLECTSREAWWHSGEGCRSWHAVP